MTTRITREMMKRISSHYAHACKKHPHFADVTFGEDTLTHCKALLELCRAILDKEVAVKNVCAEDLLLEEMLETAEAVADGDNAHAVEEIYDTIAVLLRMADMIQNGNGK